MKRNERETTGRYGLFTAFLAAILAVSACSAPDPASIAWSDDPCGLAEPQIVAAAFGIDPVSIGNAPDGECRYRVGDGLMRLTVLSDSNSCAAVIRSYETTGSSVVSPPNGRDGVFVAEPQGDVLVCDEQATYVMIAPGRTEQLLELTATLPSERSD
jgi:hypothetical protein